MAGNHGEVTGLLLIPDPGQGSAPPAPQAPPPALDDMLASTPPETRPMEEDLAPGVPLDSTGPVEEALAALEASKPKAVTEAPPAPQGGNLPLFGAAALTAAALATAEVLRRRHERQAARTITRGTTRGVSIL